MTRPVDTPAGSYVARSLGGTVEERTWIAWKETLIRTGPAVGLLDRPPATRRARQGQTPVHVSMTAHAYGVIDEELGIRADGLETGGWLTGSAATSYPQITDATGAGSNPIRTGDSFEPDWDQALDFQESLTRAGHPDKLIGHWHTHPRESVTPSKPDLGMWREFKRRTDSSLFLGLILTVPNDEPVRSGASNRPT